MLKILRNLREGGTSLELAITPKEAIFQTVIVGVDFSPYSKLVVRQAEILAIEFHAKLILAYAIVEPWQLEHPEAYSSVTTPPLDREILEAEKKIQSFYKPKQNAKIFIAKASPPSVLSFVVDSNPGSLIVIGSRGLGAVSRFLLGANAEQIALTSSCPVWVHRGPKIVRFDRILIPIDLSQNAQRVIHLIKTWTAIKELRQKFLFVSPEAPETVDPMEFRMSSEKLSHAVHHSLREFKDSRGEVPLISDEGDPAERICHFGENFDVIAVNPHNRSGFFGTFGKVTTKVIRTSHVPVLVLKP